MSNFEDQLWSQLVRERGEQMRAAPRATAALASSVTATRPATRRALRLRRPALLTGSALGIAGLATAGVLAITSASPAFAVTKNPDGTVADHPERPFRPSRAQPEARPRRGSGHGRPDQHELLGYGSDHQPLRRERAQHPSRSRGHQPGHDRSQPDPQRRDRSARS